jgi:ABC-2 type transport system ATP-binding protein
MSARVVIKNVSKNFGSFVAVDGVSFSVDKGEILGFIGPNGAGKSTTMRMVTGYIAPSAGSISVCGHDVVEASLEAKRCLGYLPEGGPLYNDMTPADFLHFIGEVRGLESQKIKERFDYVVSKLHLERVLYQSIDTLSKGFKRRVALAQAILHDPEVLVLDEPTDGLDPNQKYEVQQLITSMAEEKAVIISTHILEEVEAICSRAVIISQGKIVEEGAPDKIASRAPEHNAVYMRIKGGKTD